MRDFKKLDVWKKAHLFYKHIKQKIAPVLPPDEKFEMTRQLTRAAFSVPMNIAEGCGRYTNKDFAHFLDMALGSLNEADYACFAASDMEFITTGQYQEVSLIAGEVRGMLISFIKFVRNQE